MSEPFGYKRTQSGWHNYGLLIALVVGWLTWEALHTYFVWRTSLFPHGEAPWLMEAVTQKTENYLSEWHFAVVITFLTIFLYCKHSTQSADPKDGRDATEKANEILEQNERILTELAAIRSFLRNKD